MRRRLAGRGLGPACCALFTIYTGCESGGERLPPGMAEPDDGGGSNGGGSTSTVAPVGRRIGRRVVRGRSVRFARRADRSPLPLRERPIPMSAAQVAHFCRHFMPKIARPRLARAIQTRLPSPTQRNAVPSTGERARSFRQPRAGPRAGRAPFFAARAAIGPASSRMPVRSLWRLVRRRRARTTRVCSVATPPGVARRTR